MHRQSVKRLLRKTCRSELAREGGRNAAFIQAVLVFIRVHREQACSYRIPSSCKPLPHQIISFGYINILK